jgi:hypothetical protein
MNSQPAVHSLPEQVIGAAVRHHVLQTGSDDDEEKKTTAVPRPRQRRRITVEPEEVADAGESQASAGERHDDDEEPNADEDERKTEDPHSEAIALGEQAAEYVKSVIRHGAGNVKRSLVESEGRSHLAAENSKNVARGRVWRLGLREKLSQLQQVFYRAGAIEKAGGGNCQEHADLAFTWLHQNTEGLTISYAKGADHAFVIIGDPDDRSTWVVVDPWPAIPRVGPYQGADGRESRFVCQPFESWAPDLRGIQTGHDGDLEAMQTAGRDAAVPTTPLEKLPAMSAAALEKRMATAYDVS